jgi:predicted GNAT family N-acyltransferase
MAVDRGARGRGVGALLLAEADRRATERGAGRIELHAQQSARSVYARAGYEPRGRPFVEEGIDHIAMQKTLP